MSSSKISQREARRLKKRVAMLEAAEKARRSRWAADWPGGQHVMSRIDTTDANVINLCRKLGHAVVVNTNGSNEIYYHAIPTAKEPI